MSIVVQNPPNGSKSIQTFSAKLPYNVQQDVALKPKIIYFIACNERTIIGGRQLQMICDMAFWFYVQKTAMTLPAPPVRKIASKNWP